MARGKHDRQRRSHSPPRRKRSSSGEHKRSSSGEHKRKSKRSPGSRDEGRRRSSGSSRERHSSGSRERRKSPRPDDRGKRPSPGSARPSKKTSILPFGRGRRPTRDNSRRKTRTQPLKKSNSRSTSRSTSRGSSRNRRILSVELKGNSSPTIGFGLSPTGTPVPSSRLDGHLYLALSSIVALSSLAVGVPPDYRGPPEVLCLTMQGISVSLSLGMGMGLRYDLIRRRLTHPLFRGPMVHHMSLETVLNSLQLLLWSLAIALTTSVPLLAHDDSPSDIWNSNLYYSTVTSFSLSAFLVADSCTSETPQIYWGEGYNFKACRLQRNWALVLLAQLGLVAACWQGTTVCEDNCSKFTMGIVMGMTGALVALGHFFLRTFETVKRKRTRGAGEGVSLMGVLFSSINFVVSSANALLLSDCRDEYSSVNAFFACWICFFLGLNLCLRYLDAHFSPGSVLNDAEWAKINSVQVNNGPKSHSFNDNYYRRASTGSTKASESSNFSRHIQDAATASKYLESMVASNESSEPILYLDKGTAASPLSLDEEFGQQPQMLMPPPLTARAAQTQRKEPSFYMPSQGKEPLPNSSNTSRQNAVPALPPSAMRRRPSTSAEPQSSSTPSQQASSRKSSKDPQESTSTPSQQRSARRQSVRALPPPPRRARKDPSVAGTATGSSFAPQAREDAPNSSTSIASQNNNRTTRKAEARNRADSFSNTSEHNKRLPQGQASAPRSSSAGSEYKRASINTQANVARSISAESVSTASQYEYQNSQVNRPRKPWGHIKKETTMSMTQFVTTTYKSKVPTPTQMSPPVETDSESTVSENMNAPTTTACSNAPNRSSMLSLFGEGSIQDIKAAMAQVELSTEESSPNTLDPPPTLDPSHSSKMHSQRASPSIRSGRTKSSKGSKNLSRAQSYPSRSRSGPSPNTNAMSGSSRRSSTTHGSRGPPTLSDCSGSPRTNEPSSEPRTISENEDVIYNVDLMSASVQGRPVREFSTDEVSIVSEPTMDGFDQSQRFDLEQSQNSLLERRNTTGTVNEGEHVSQTGTVDKMVMMALRQAYEARQQSLRQAGGDSTSRDQCSSMQDSVSRRASIGEAELEIETAKSNTFRYSSERTGGSSGKSIRSFYSHNDNSNNDESSAFAC